MPTEWGDYHEPDESGYNPDDLYYKKFKTKTEKQEDFRQKKEFERQLENEITRAIKHTLKEQYDHDGYDAQTIVVYWLNEVNMSDLDIHLKSNILGGLTGVLEIIESDYPDITMRELSQRDIELYEDIIQAIAKFIKKTKRYIRHAKTERYITEDDTHIQEKTSPSDEYIAQIEAELREMETKHNRPVTIILQEWIKKIEGGKKVYDIKKVRDKIHEQLINEALQLFQSSLEILEEDNFTGTLDDLKREDGELYNDIISMIKILINTTYTEQTRTHADLDEKKAA